MGFYIVKVGTAVNNGVSLSEAIDSITQDVYEYGAAVLDPETDDVRQDLVDRFECIGGDLMFLHLMKIFPAHRGRNLGLVAASRLIDSYATGLVVCRPQPLQQFAGSLTMRARRRRSSSDTGAALASSPLPTTASTRSAPRTSCRR